MSLSKCPVCDSSHIHDYLHLKYNDLKAAKCKKCAHIFITNSPINSSNAHEYYTMDDYKGDRREQEITYNNYYNDCFADYEKYLDQSMVLQQFKEKVCCFNELIPKKGKLLDIGCATGVFLDMARKDGWDVEGIEISDDLAKYSRETMSLKVHQVDLSQESLPGQKYDAISMFDVIEHLPNLNAMIASCGNLLEDGGYFLIRTPTEEGLLRGLAKMAYRCSFNKFEYPMKWFYSYEHLQSFSLKSLKALLARHGMKVEKVVREEESMDRLDVSGFVNTAIKGVNLISAGLRKQHKITVFAKKEVASQ